MIGWGLKVRKRVNQADPFEDFFQSSYQRIDLLKEAKKSRKNCLSQLKALQGGYKGSVKDFKRKVLPFWGKYNIRPRKIWYDLYCFSDNKYNPLYIPGDFYWQKIYPALNKVAFRRAYTNKCFYDRVFPHLKKPKTILCNINGIYIDGEGKLISFKKACSILKSNHSFVLKPGFYSGGGKDIYFHIGYNGDNKINNCKDIELLLNLYKADFIVQELVKQHKTLSTVHPESLNTIRTISYLFENKVHISSSILRMGTFGRKADNFSMGGIACPINEDGRLDKFAVNPKTRWISSHPSSGIVFDTIWVPAYHKILELIKEIHLKVPFFKIIGWDFAVDEIGEPIFIEYNGAPDLNQLSCGPLFGELTQAVLDKYICS